MKKIKRYVTFLFSSLTAGIAIKIAFQTNSRLKESIPYAGYSHNHLTKKKIEKVVASEPTFFQKGTIKTIFGMLTYDMSHLKFPSISYLECDVHLGSITVVIPSNVNVILNSHSVLGNCAALTGRYLDDKIPRLYINARANMGTISVRCIDDFQS